VPAAGQQQPDEVPVVTRTAFVGLGLAMILLAFAVPYAARGGLRPGGGDAKAAQQRSVLGPSAATGAIVLGDVPPLPQLGRAPSPAAATAAPAPRAVVPRVVVAPGRVGSPRPSSPPAVPPGGGGGGSFNNSG